MGVEVVYTLSLRAPDEVIGSIREANPLKSRNGAYLLCLRYVLDSEFETRRHTRIIVPFSNLLQNWEWTCQNIADQLEIKINLDDVLAREKLNAFISTDLVHHKCEAKSPPSKTGPEAWAMHAYDLLYERQFSRITQSDCELLDEIRT